jgi:hypothetical protein
MPNAVIVSPASIKGNRERSIQCLTARRGRKKERTVNQLGFESGVTTGAQRSLALRTRARHGQGRRSRHAPTLDIASTLADMLKKEFGAARKAKLKCRRDDDVSDDDTTMTRNGIYCKCSC